MPPYLDTNHLFLVILHISSPSPISQLIIIVQQPLHWRVILSVIFLLELGFLLQNLGTILKYPWLIDLKTVFKQMDLKYRKNQELMVFLKELTSIKDTDQQYKIVMLHKNWMFVHQLTIFIWVFMKSSLILSLKDWMKIDKTILIVPLFLQETKHKKTLRRRHGNKIFKRFS